MINIVWQTVDSTWVRLFGNNLQKNGRSLTFVGICVGWVGIGIVFVRKEQPKCQTK